MANAVTISGRSAGVLNSVSGTIVSTGTAAAATISLGFIPRYVRVVDVTGLIIWEKFDGMSASDTIKIVSGASNQVTNTAGSDILINTDGTITLSSTLCGTGKTICWIASV